MTWLRTEVALPDPHTVAVAEVRERVVPLATAARDYCREHGDLEAARELARRLDAFARYLRDREGRDLMQAEVRRTEVLIGQLLGPAEPGRPPAGTSHASDIKPIPREDRHRFRTLAEHAERVEELLTAGVTTRRAILDKLRIPPRAEGDPPSPLITSDGRFSTIVADPPWRYGNAGTRANAEGHYDGTLSVDQLCGREAMPDGSKLPEQVAAWRADDAHLYLWTTAGFLREAFDVMDAWGFEYKTFLAWVKPQMGMGNYFRVSAELVLFGVRGRLPVEDRSLMNWFQAPRGKHSAKPATFYDLVGRASPGPYLEMFARCYAVESLPGTCMCARCSRGWDVWGNET
jgi:N6-adenosine-specific RNA methylase IME4